MSKKSNFQDFRYTDRWFCFFDLLGFSSLIHSEDIKDVIRTYNDVLDTLEKKHAKNISRAAVTYSWFSDSFILYTRGKSLEQFVLLEQTARLFFSNLIRKKIPLRGAMSFGKLYSKVDRNTFVGPALIDAYKHGEDQDWVGYILAPSACKELSGTSLDPSSLAFYRPLESTAIMRKLSNDNIFAFAFNNDMNSTPSSYELALEEMRKNAPDKEKYKYERALSFASKHRLNRF